MRRIALAAIAFGSLLSLPAISQEITGAAVETSAGPVVEVWKAESCGCCEGWVKHMRDSGFTVSVHVISDVAMMKVEKGVPDALASCHTAVVDGYIVEGHVPAEDVRRLLAERPKAVGLSAPGMPMSAPGMDMPGYAYDVVLFGAEGGQKVFARH